MRQILFLLYIAYLLFVIVLIFFSRKKPMQRVSWILVLIFVPVVGVVFYLLVGSESYWDYKREKIRRRHRYLFNELDQIIRNLKSELSSPSSIQEFHIKCCGSRISSNNDVEIFTNGTPKFVSLFQDLREAKDHIHVQYFTIHNDAIGQELISILKEKSKQGVEVKLLYDSFGCLTTWVRPLFWELKDAGGKVRGIRPYARALNYRNHRKLVIIDGKIGYLGGMNAGEHYANGVKGMEWRDTHLRVVGESVYDLQYIFISDWIASSQRKPLGFGKKLRYYFPKTLVVADLQTQIVASGLYDKHMHQNVINLSYFGLINSAKSRLWIQTPYFSPTEPILQSLKVLALNGVDVRIMTSAYYAFGGLFHHNIKNYYFRQLIDSGVRVFRYKGILHSKVMLIDQDKVVIGTVNLNVRSLERDDELYAFFQSSKLNEEHGKELEMDFARSVELDYVKFQKQTLLSRALESIVSLFSPFS